ARKLLAARDLFVRCAQSSCPAAVKRECARWLDETSAKIPTIVPVARVDGGDEIGDARVLVDGATPPERVPGAAIAVDPGAHTLPCEAPGRGPVEVRLVAREGEHDRIVTATFPRRGADAVNPRDAQGGAASGVNGAPLGAPDDTRSRTATPSRFPAAAYVTGA